MTCKQPSRSTNTWLLCTRKGLFFLIGKRSVVVYSLMLCDTHLVWCTKNPAQGSWRRGWEHSYPLRPGAVGCVSWPQAFSSTPHLLPALSLLRRQLGYLNCRKTRETLLLGWWVEAFWAFLRPEPEQGREILWLGKWTWDATVGGDRGSRGILSTPWLCCGRQALAKWQLHFLTFVKQTSCPQTFFVIESRTNKSNILN